MVIIKIIQTSENPSGNYQNISNLKKTPVVIIKIYQTSKNPNGNYQNITNLKNPQ